MSLIKKLASVAVPLTVGSVAFFSVAYANPRIEDIFDRTKINPNVEEILNLVDRAENGKISPETNIGEYDGRKGVFRRWDFNGGNYDLLVFYDFNHGTANETGGVIREPYLIFMNNTDSMDWDSAGNIYLERQKDGTYKKSVFIEGVST
ncbi:MAG TPA: hypothetical protein VJ208_03790 [Candidatus Nanoarchaeia archaeon]|nr:hypothetical protein [Candidatus Nanoarchaeia archaeon]